MLALTLAQAVSEYILNLYIRNGGESNNKAFNLDGAGAPPINAGLCGYHSSEGESDAATQSPGRITFHMAIMQSSFTCAAIENPQSEHRIFDLCISRDDSVCTESESQLGQLFIYSALRITMRCKFISLTLKIKRRVIATFEP
ncbi:hypothetical protein [Thalassolituus sp.]|uniref:hypothetical protein n=1 Tax=Thalassolituus sp. TaxID=2030822 RepID=UPI002637EBA7|nr:hypothetical protein [Thalassolituus sp.]